MTLGIQEMSHCLVLLNQIKCSLSFWFSKISEMSKVCGRLCSSPLPWAIEELQMLWGANLWGTQRTVPLLKRCVLWLPYPMLSWSVQIWAAVWGSQSSHPWVTWGPSPKLPRSVDSVLSPSSFKGLHFNRLLSTSAVQTDPFILLSSKNQTQFPGNSWLLPLSNFKSPSLRAPFLSQVIQFNILIGFRMSEAQIAVRSDLFCFNWTSVPIDGGVASLAYNSHHPLLFYSN